MLPPDLNTWRPAGILCAHLHEHTGAINAFQVSQIGELLSRRGRRLAANVCKFDTHCDSISSRFDRRSPATAGTSSPPPMTAP
jgi:hypothetical protein